MAIEGVLAQLSTWFLSPVLLVLTATVCYALCVLFLFVLEACSRFLSLDIPCALTHEVQRNPDVSLETLELVMLTELEGLRIVSRLAPILGVMAAMMALAPSLLTLTGTDASVLGEQLLLAFAAIVGALLAAGIAWGVLQVRTRWLLTEFNAFLDCSPAPARYRPEEAHREAADKRNAADVAAGTLRPFQNRMFKLL